MRRIVALPFTLGLLGLAVSSAHAQQEDVYELITTAIHVRSSETALPVTVLNDEALHAAVRATLGDTLSSQPGINNASFGPAVGQAVIRGQQGRRVMNLSNGVPNADASGNSADHAQTVEAILANAIEVLRGPSTLLYGGGAIGGVVNVIDRRIASTLPDSTAFAIEARHDTAASLDTVVGSLDLPTGNVVWHLDAMQRDWGDMKIPGFAIDQAYLEEEEEHVDEGEGERREEEALNTDGYVANTGGKTESATAGVSWILPNGFIGLAVNQLNNTYGLPPGAHSYAHDEEHEEEEHADEGDGEECVFIAMERTRYDVSGEWRNLQPWLETLTYRLSHTDYEHAEMEGPGVVSTQFSNDSWQHRLQLTHAELGSFHGVLGLQHSNEKFGAVGAESFIPVADIDSSGIFLVEDFHVMDVTLEFGARLNRDDYSPQNSPAPARDFSTTSFSASALWDLSAPATLGLLVSRSERAPSIEELYSNYGLADPEDCVLHFATGACELGNVNLGEETSFNTDLTLYLELGRFSATFTGFYNDFSDYISQVTSGAEVEGFPIRPYQQDDATFTGIEVDASIELNESTVLRIFGDTIRGSFARSGAVPRMPPNRIGAELTVTGAQWSAFALLLHATAQDRPGAFELASDAWTRVDIGADYTFDIGNQGELLVFVKGRNIGDEEIRLSTSYLRGFAPEAGRSVEAGVRYRF